MADKKYEIELKIAADVAEIKKATEELNVFKNQFASIRRTIETGFQLNIGAGIGNQIKSIVSGALPAYAKQEAAERGLAAAMESTGVGVADNLEAFKKLASQIQSITTIGDESVLAMQKMALNMGVDKVRMQDCIEGAIGLQKAYGMGLNESIKAAAAVVQGKTEKLNELIPALKDCKSNEERLKLANEAMSNGYSQAKDEINTLSGSLKQLSNAWGDVSEIVGETVAPMVKQGAEILKSIAEWLTKNKTFTIELTRAVIALAAAIAANKIAIFLKSLKAVSQASVEGTAATATNTITLAKNTALTVANTAAKIANANASKAQAAAEVINSSQKAAKSVYDLKIATETATVSAGSLSKVWSGFRGILNSIPGIATIALGAAIWGWSRLYGQIRKDLTEHSDALQKELESCAEKQKRTSNSMIASLRAEGATRENLTEIIKKTELALEYAKIRLANAKRNGLDTKPIMDEISAHNRLLGIIQDERESYTAIRAAKIAAYESNAVENVSVAKDKYSDTKRTDAQKLENVSAAIATKTMSIADLERQISEAQGEQKLKLSEHYKIETDKLIALEAQQKTLQKNIDSEKKAAADKIAAQEKELNAAAEKAAALKNEMSLENRILIAKREGNDKLVKYLEDEKKIAALKEQIVNAEKTQYTTAEGLKQLEADAEERARNRVGLENAALKAEQERAKLKSNEKATEDYLWRLKIAQAKLRGDDKAVKKIENARDSKREIDALVAGGMDRNRAEAMVTKTRATEQAAEEKGVISPIEGILTSRRERRPITSTTKHGADGKIANAFISPIDRRRALNPPSPKSGGKVKNPAAAAGGNTEDPQQKEIVSLLTEAKSFLEKFDSALKDIKNNTAATATKKEKI